MKVPAGCELVLTRNYKGEQTLRWTNPQGGGQTTPFLITKISEPAETATPITKIA